LTFPLTARSASKFLPRGREKKKRKEMLFKSETEDGEARIEC
jgi:hypothetical protein